MGDHLGIAGIPEPAADVDEQIDLRRPTARLGPCHRLGEQSDGRLARSEPSATFDPGIVEKVQNPSGGPPEIALKGSLAAPGNQGQHFFVGYNSTRKTRGDTRNPYLAPLSHKTDPDTLPVLPIPSPDHFRRHFVVGAAGVDAELHPGAVGRNA